MADPASTLELLSSQNALLERLTLAVEAMSDPGPSLPQWLTLGVVSLSAVFALV
jgi:hypothetical protein